MDHVASPLLLEQVTNSQSQLVTSALEGIHNVLGSVNKTESVVLVVLTSKFFTKKGA
jgi:hypothetical protein